ncbi:MAG: O-antigen ligase family protein [Trichodesmium sp.]
MNYHSNLNLKQQWKLTLVGLLLFPLFPTLGALTLIWATITTWKQKWRSMIRRPHNIALAGLGLWLAIASCFALQPQEAFLGLANLLPFFGVFAAFATLIQTPSQLRQLSWVMLISSVPVIILGFGQLFFGWSGSLNLQIILGWVLAPQGNPPGRMASVFMYANILAIYLSIVLILGLGLWVEQWKLFRKREIGTGNQEHHKIVLTGNFTKNLSRWKIWLSSSVAKFIFLTVVIIGNSIALIFTHSRNAWVLVVFSALAYAIYLGWYWLIGLVTATVATIFGAAFAPLPLSQWLRAIVPEYFWARLTDRDFERPIATLRTTQWQFAWNLTWEKPWSGWGLRNFTPLYEAQMQIWLGHPHNLFLMLTAETGIPAALFLFGWVGWIFGKAVLLLVNWSSVHSGEDRLIFFSYLVAFAACTIFNMFDVTLFDFRVNTIGWLLLAAICGLGSSVRQSNNIKSGSISVIR